MRKVKRQSVESVNEIDLFSDHELDLTGFIESMETESSKRKRQSRTDKERKRRLDAWQDAISLRKQLEDWSDWNKD